MAKLKIGLACSGSGFLAPAEAGFVYALMTNGVEFTNVAGTSGGSIIAAAIACGFTAEDLKTLALGEFPKGICSYSILSAASSVLRGGFWLNNGEILEEYLRETFGLTSFEKAKIPATIMATNLSRGKTIEFSWQTSREMKIARACRASSSIPYIYKPVEVDGDLIIDGGVRNNIPTNKLHGSTRVGVRIEDGGIYSTTSILGMTKQIISSLLDANEDNLVAWATSTGAIIKQIDCSPYSFLNAEMTLVEKQDLFGRGVTAGESALTALFKKKRNSVIN